VDDHPELQEEQAHLTRAYERLEQLRRDTRERLRSVLAQGTGTPQYLEERDVIVRTSLARLEQLEIGDQALCFGRIDRVAIDGQDQPPAGSANSAGSTAEGRASGPTHVPERNGSGLPKLESFHIGRLGVSGEDLEPLVVDWRAPVAEPFYRATGRDPMGLVLRRHIAAEGSRVTGIEDERFALDRSGRGTSGEAELGDDLQVGGPGALLAALEGARTGRMRDIVATIQGEQDAIIRSELPGVLVVQGGPGTGKTAVALHRAAYLLYTHRFPLERQGVLVVGPNPLFLRYIERVLPSLGESGVTLSTISGLVHGFQVRADDPPEVARLKGDDRMARVVARAVRTRQHPLPKTVEVPFGSVVLHLTPQMTSEVVASARRRPGTHNARRRFVEQLIVRRLADEYRKTREGLSEPAASAESAELALWRSLEPDAEAEPSPQAEGGSATLARGGAGAAGAAGVGPAPDATEFDISDFGRRLRQVPTFMEALDRIWPRLSADELLHDLFGAPALLQVASRGILSTSEQRLLHRRRSASLSEVPFTAGDAALVDEARVLLGPRNHRRSGAPETGGNQAYGPSGTDEEGPRTYGHIVVDEAQDLSPMQLRMIGRRSLSGSVTVVGDIGQATGPWAADRWDGVTAHLPRQRPARLVELTVSYRTPAEVMEVASGLLKAVAPMLEPPAAIRRTGVPPTFVATTPEDLAAEVALSAADLSAELQPGTVAVLAPASLVAEIALALDAAGVRARDPRRDGLGAPVSLLPVDLANGLEFDGVVVVEPAAVVEESPQGLRRLYVAMTRPTRRLSVLHARPLPAPLRAWDPVAARD